MGNTRFYHFDAKWSKFSKLTLVIRFAKPHLIIILPPALGSITGPNAGIKQSCSIYSRYQVVLVSIYNELWCRVSYFGWF